MVSLNFYSWTALLIDPFFQHDGENLVNELQDENAKVSSTNGRKRKTAPPKQPAKRGKKTDDKMDT
jgi:hypothetical protein